MKVTSEKSVIKMAILNITQWSFEYTIPRAYYGKLILCTHPDVTFHNIKEFNVNTLGEKIEITREINRKEALKLDRKYWNNLNTMLWDQGDRSTIRFDDIDELTGAGMEIYRKLNLEMPFISVLEGKKFSGTRTLNENEVNYLVRYKRSAREWVLYFFSEEADEQDREIGENMIKQHGSLENLLNSDWVNKMQDEHDRMDLFETDD